MNGANAKKSATKQKLIHELAEYSFNAAYLALFFGGFIMYKRLILAEFQIGYEDYGIVLIKALILAKVIMLGDILRLGRKLEDRPLIFPTLYKGVVFSVWVAVFGIFEHVLKGLLHGKGLAGGIEELLSEGKYELLAQCMVVFLALIPFFAFRELERVLGEGKVSGLFIRRRPVN